MRFSESVLPPVERPVLAHAKVVGDPLLERQVFVAVGHVAFRFWRADGHWTGGEAVTVGRGTLIDEGWLTAARGVAVQALNTEIAGVATDRGDFVPTETIRCESCGRLMTSSLLVFAESPRRKDGLSCGPVHVVTYENGRAIALRPDGSSVWITSDADLAP